MLIVNDNLQRYKGELMIVISEIKAGDNYNYVGHLNEEEQLVLDCIRPSHSFVMTIR